MWWGCRESGEANWAFWAADVGRVGAGFRAVQKGHGSQIAQMSQVVHVVLTPEPVECYVLWIFKLTGAADDS